MTEPVLDIVAKLQEQLARMQGQAGEPPAGTGEALDGKLRITVTSGNVSEVTLEPRAMRQASEDLAAAIKDAVNQAIEQAGHDMRQALANVQRISELHRRRPTG